MKHRKKAALLLGAGAALGAAAAAAGCVRITAKVLRRPAEQPHKEPTGERAARIEQVRRQAARLVEQYPPEEVTITSDDGLALHGLVFTPPDADKVAVLVHGYHSSGLREFGSIAWYYIRRGWRVLLVDDRAHGQSEGDVIGFGTLDRRDLLQWLRYCSIRFGRQQPIVMHGVSMGAATVMMATGLDLPENVRAAVADCGYTSVWDEFDHVLHRRHLPAALCLPLADWWARRRAGYGLRECDASQELKQAAVPVLFIHGEQDDFVPVWMTEKNYDACSTLKMKWICPGAGHAESWFCDEAGYTRAMDEFYAAALRQ